MSRILIVGGGIIGTAIAAELTGQGAEVYLISDRGVGGGATAAGMGHLVALDGEGAKAALTTRSLEQWADLELPRDDEREDCGTLWVAETEDDMVRAAALQTRLRTKGVASELVVGEELGQLEPELRRDLPGALLVPSDAVIYPPHAARLFWRRAETGGAKWIDALATRVEPRRVHLADGRELEGDVVVVAAGDRTVALLPQLPVRPKKGHLLITSRASEPFVRHQIVELGYGKTTESRDPVSIACNVQPRPTGQVLVGSSRQEGERSSEVEISVLRRMLRRASELFPRLPELVALRAWTGFRAATPDGAPIIGLVEKGLAVATGHEGLGVTQAPATARLLGHLLAGAKTDLDPMPFDPHRFSRGFA